MQISLARGSASGGRPVYRQIADQIRAAIEADRLEEGSRLPPIRALARELGVNRDTVALAYEELGRAGVVESTVGRGTFVSRAAVPAPAGFDAALSPLAERLVQLERARPRFGSGAAAAPLHSLVPDPALYPVDGFRRALDRVLRAEGSDLLLYGGPQGLLRMREVLAARLGEVGVARDPDELVLCHGASQGIALALRLFAGRVLARPDVKLFYSIPTFHNPMGITTRTEHRRELLERAARWGKPVVEDAYEADLRFEGRAVPPLAALDDSGLVVHLSSFSKSLFPGVRVGALAARGRLVNALLALKQATDLSDAMPLQAALAEFVAEGAYDRHLARLRRVLRGRRDALLEALERELPPGSRWTRPEGGYQVWVELPNGIDTSELLPDAVAAGVLFAPGAWFHHDGRPSSALRLTFAMADEASLRSGVAALGAVIRGSAASGPRADRVPI
jgi:DNA-binding transcriptional MocR family regulator